MPENKKFLVEHPGCGYCKVVKVILAPKIADGSIGVIDASTQEGMDIAKNNGIVGVPDCLELDEQGNYKPCSIEDLLPKRPSAPVEIETSNAEP
jgi:hypothetical protein